MKQRITRHHKSRLAFHVMLAVGVLSLYSTLMLGQNGKPPWMNPGLSPDARADLLVKQLTLTEKISLVHGAEWQHNVWVNGQATPAPTEMISGAAGFVPGIPHLGIPAIQMVDAPLGVTRGGFSGRYSTALPSGLALASSWNSKLAFETGALIGREVLDAGFNMALGGGCNLDREPRNGRNFEYMGEDPALAGTMVGAEVNGLQGRGVIGVMKHFALNDQETRRNSLDAILDERSLRETDLLSFEIGVREAHPLAVMCAYNKVNGTHSCENPFLLNQTLKHDFGFKGFVLSDWKATHSTVSSALAGLDMEMPDDIYFGTSLEQTVKAGTVPEKRLDDMVHRILYAEFKAGLFDRKSSPQVTDVFGGLEFAQKAAEESIVLLKNEHHLLPLNGSKIRSIALIGGHADVGVLAGGGSSLVDPPGGSAIPAPTPRSVVYDSSSPLRTIAQLMQRARVHYVSGENPVLAAREASNADIAIVFAVQPEREDTDLASLQLPGNQDEVITRVAKANPRTIVVLESGSAVTMPWIPNVPAVIEAWYPGIRGAEALAEILAGHVNPSGKLPVTFPKSEADLPRPQITKTPDQKPTVRYDEGLKVGYKWYDAQKKVPLFAFGHGLSYTQFQYSSLRVDNQKLSVRFDLSNVGSKSGKETSQIYVAFPPGSAEPPKRLVGWTKAAIAAGEIRHITVEVDPFLLSVFDSQSHQWKRVSGTYHFYVGGASDNLPLTEAVNLLFSDAQFR